MLPGHLHHLGCDQERCPRCNRQAFSCGCRFDEDLDEEIHHELEAHLDELLGIAPPARTPAEVLEELFGERRPAAPDLLPAASLTTALGVHHHTSLARFRSWAETHDHRFDLDAAALVFACLQPHQRPDGDHRSADGPPSDSDGPPSDSDGQRADGRPGRLFELRRPHVAAVVHRARTAAEDARAEVPPMLVETIAAVLAHLHADGCLDEGCDPLAALMEPLCCHFGLASPGGPPAVCQCFAPFDPDCPPGMRLVQLRCGRLVRAHDVALLGPPSPPGGTPLDRFAARLLQQRAPGAVTAELSEHVLVGHLEATGDHPDLWVHTHLDRPGGWDGLYLDDDGGPWVTWCDRRFRDGYRWESISPLQAAWMSHIPFRTAEGAIC